MKIGKDVCFRGVETGWYVLTSWSFTVLFCLFVFKSWFDIILNYHFGFDWRSATSARRKEFLA